MPSKMWTWSQSAWLVGVGRVRVDVRQLRNQPGQLGKGRPGRVGDTARIDVPDEGAQGLDDRAERESVVAEGDGATLEDEPAVVAQAVRDLRDEPGLADARLTADEHQRGTPGNRGVGRSEEYG